MKRSSYRRYITVGGLAIAIMLFFAILYSPIPTPATTAPPTANTDTGKIEKNPDSISIPGFEALTLRADSTIQTVCLSNPPQNCCYFQITLSLEDGTILWQSELIAPDETSKPMVLSKELSAGTYAGAMLTYDCFQMNEALTPLNGAETKLTLVVK